MAMQLGFQTPTGLPAGDVLARIEALLDQVSSERDALDPGVRLAWAKIARRVAARTDALASVLLAEADRARASLTAVGTPTGSWLGTGTNLSRRESAGLLHRAKELGQHPEVGRAAVAGELSAGQARAITGVLDELAPQLDEQQQNEAERLLVRWAQTRDAEQLAKAAPRVLAEVAPATANEVLEQRLQRQAEAAHRNRSLVFTRDNFGSTRFTGSLPVPEAEAWLAILNTHLEAGRRTALEERDPLATRPSPEQRRADALIEMIHAHRRDQRPGRDADRARVVVKLDYDALHRQAAGAGLIGDDEPLSAGDLRRLCCDADLVPAVLGTQSEVLDIGRSTRRIPTSIRTALTLRDAGCAFPGCHTRPEVCEAHHVVPWWAGGPTSLANLVLLCHHHHGLAEPARHGIRDQWLARIAADGVPEFIPPRRCDATQTPVRHQRYLAGHSPPNDPQGRGP